MEPIWIAPWRPADYEHESTFLCNQLNRELTHGHPLFGAKTIALARRDDLNDVLFGLDDGRVAVVHLTFTKGPFTKLIPWAQIFASLNDFHAESRNQFGNPGNDTPRLDPDHPDNIQPLKSLFNENLPRFGTSADIQDDHTWEFGPPAEKLRRVWMELGSRLPADGRCLIYSRPALISPKGVILAVLREYDYALRVPPEVLEWAIDSVSRMIGERAREEQADLRSEFGDGWLIGAYLDHEIGWCRQMYAFYA